MKRIISSLLLALIGGIILSSFHSISFHARKITIEKNLLDTTIPIKTVRGKLGATGYYIQKPTDCIENIIREDVNERSYSIYAREPKDRAFHGSCMITVDQSYFPRVTQRTNERIIRDTILDKVISVKEFMRDNFICCEGEIATGQDFIYFNCEGTTQWELHKFYNVAKSLSK
jgi:hypothetical protein